MCSRFAFMITRDDLEQAFPWIDFPFDLPGSYNISPSQPIPIVRNQAPSQLDFGIWGLIAPYERDPATARKFINARSETVFDRVTFKNPVKYRRCMVPASGFYEWKNAPTGKETYYFTMKDGSPFMMAGIYNVWEGIDGSTLQTCTILTTDSNGVIGPIHQRMPVILRHEFYDMWLEKRPVSELYLRNCFIPYDPREMKAQRVSPYVNNVRNDGPQCIAPYDESMNEDAQLNFF